MYLQKKQEA